MVNFSVFNELSLPFNTDTDIEKNFIQFFQILKELQDKNLTKIRMDKEFKNYHILDGISFFQFYGQLDHGTFKDRLRSFIVNEIIKIDSPLVTIDDTQEQEILLENEYYYNNKANESGLACADLWNTIAISFNTDTNWDTNCISLKKSSIEKDGNIIEQNIDIIHASRLIHLNTHVTFFNRAEKEMQLDVNQETFWEKKDALFKDKIILCNEVEEQIKSLQSPKFYEALSILRDLEKGFKQLNDYNISGEGRTVRTNPKLNKFRQFTINGRKEYFWNHIKNFGDHRIHYIERGDKIYIGYIGPHLPTKNDS